MAGGLVWSLRSLAELGDIADYIAKNSPFYANMVVHRMVERAELLSEMARQGGACQSIMVLSSCERYLCMAGGSFTRWWMKQCRLAIIHAARSLENAAPL